MNNLWDIYGLDVAAINSGFIDGEGADHSFGLLTYSLIYAHRAQRVVVLGYDSGYVPVLATAGQLATGRRGLIVSIDPNPCDGGEYVRNHGYGLEIHRFMKANLKVAATEAVRFLDGLIDALIVNLSDPAGAMGVYHPLLASNGLALVRGLPVEIRDLKRTSISPLVSLYTRERK